MNSLIGIWMYSSLIYQGQPIPKPNPDLKMYYTFKSDQQNEIYYYRENENGFCRRTASYEVLDNTRLIQKVVEVDPDNADFCGQDPDMQLGTTTEVNFEIKNDKLYLELQLGEDTLVYVWEK
jgi:hypothetical protein